MLTSNLFGNADETLFLVFDILRLNMVSVVCSNGFLCELEICPGLRYKPDNVLYDPELSLIN